MSQTESSSGVAMPTVSQIMPAYFEESLKLMKEQNESIKKIEQHLYILSTSLAELVRKQ